MERKMEQMEQRHQSVSSAFLRASFRILLLLYISSLKWFFILLPNQDYVEQKTQKSDFVDLNKKDTDKY